MLPGYRYVRGGPKFMLVEHCRHKGRRAARSAERVSACLVNLPGFGLAQINLQRFLRIALRFPIMIAMGNGTGPRLCLEFEVDAGQKIVRVSCFNSRFERAPSYVGAPLTEIVVFDDLGGKRAGEADLADGSSCTYKVQPGDPYSKVSVSTSCAEAKSDLAGCFAHPDRLAEIIDSVSGLPYTFGAAVHSSDAASDEQVCHAQHSLLHTLHDPMALVACDGPVIYFVLPKIENREFGQILMQFQSQCFEAFDNTNVWKFGVVEGGRPYDTKAILIRALSQARTGNTFERRSGSGRVA